jgi:hypothetical protein
MGFAGEYHESGNSVLRDTHDRQRELTHRARHRLVISPVIINSRPMSGLIQYSLISTPMTIAVLSKPVPLPLSQERLDAINAYLSTLSPQDILAWGLEFLDDLYQTTAFGLTGLVAIDMLSKLTDSPPPLIFLDTLYHFSETYELVEEVKERYNVPVNVFKPYSCENVEEFEELFGERLWEVDEGTYDYAVKVCFCSPSCCLP